MNREELQQRIWPSDTFVDFDRGPYNAIKKLREALGDSAESPRFIETLSRRGYRFIALITDLAQISSLKVISRTSSMQYKQTKKSLPEIARELNVDGIFEGTVQRSGDRVRITAQLIQGPADKHLWANSYEENVRDVFSQNRNSRRVSR